MNDWNYTKKVTKSVLIYGITVWIYFIIARLLTGPWIHTEYYSPSTASWIGLLLLLPLIIPGFVISIPINLLCPFFSSYFNLFLLLSFYGAICWIFAGFFIDLNNTEQNKKYPKEEIKKGQREKGVFIRIPFGSRKIVVSERFVNWIIVIEIIILIFLNILTNPFFTHEETVEGKFVNNRFFDQTLNFNKDERTFIMRYSDGTTETGTYELNGTHLTLYYSDRKKEETSSSFLH